MSLVVYGIIGNKVSSTEYYNNNVIVARIHLLGCDYIS